MLENKDRKRKHSLCSILNGIFYLVKTGYRWRMLPCSFTPWDTAYYYYRKWKNNDMAMIQIMLNRIKSK
jgi:transposase